MGGEVKGFYVVMGRYDGVVITEAPNDETAAKIALALGSKGTARSETLRAFNEDEFRKIIGCHALSSEVATQIEELVRASLLESESQY